MSRNDPNVSLGDTASFYERLGEDADVRLEPGYDQDEVFDDQFERRSHEIQRTPGADNAVAIIPAKRGPWTGNNQLGIERHFAPDSNNRQSILKLDEWGFPQVWTLSLGLTYDAFLYGAGGGLAGAFAVVAEIEFGTGGVIQVVEVDWLQGMSIALPLNALNVVASYSSVPNEGGVPSLPSDLRLRASVVHGALYQSNPTRTLPVSADSPLILIPPFAKSFTIFPAAAVASPFAFYSSLGLIELLGTIAGDTVVRLQRSQFVEYLDVLNNNVGAPRHIDIPDRCRFVHLPGLTGDAFVQFRIGV
jgi:hypothetical protein